MTTPGGVRSGNGLRKRSSTMRRAHDETGSTILEMAIALPVFFLFVFGLINFCMVLFGFCNVSYASHYAARYACLHSNTSGLPTTTATINGLISPYIYSYPSNTYTTNMNYATIYAAPGNNVGNGVTVTVTITYNLVMPLFTYNGITMTSSATGFVTQ